LGILGLGDKIWVFGYLGLGFLLFRGGERFLEGEELIEEVFCFLLPDFFCEVGLVEEGGLGVGESFDPLLEEVKSLTRGRIHIGIRIKQIRIPFKEAADQV
jgi:hypothetical protein